MNFIGRTRGGVRSRLPVVKWLSAVWLLLALCLWLDAVVPSGIMGEKSDSVAAFSAVALLLVVLSWAHWKQFPVAWWFGAVISAGWIFEVMAAYTSFSGSRVIGSVIDPRNAPRYIQNHHHWRLALAFHVGLSAISLILMLAAFIITSSQPARTAYRIRHFGRNNP